SGGGSSGRASTASPIAVAAAGPRVELVTPTSAATVQGATVSVAGVALDEGHGVARVAVNGQEVAAAAGHFQATVALEPGVNTIVVEAWDALGARTERHVSVLAGAVAPADDPIARGAEVALSGAAAPLVSNFQ